MPIEKRKSWHRLDCGSCIFRVDNFCRRFPPQRGKINSIIPGEHIPRYPEVWIKYGQDQFWMAACAEHKSGDAKHGQQN